MTLIFIWDFTADTVLGQIVQWLYGKLVEALTEFFALMGNMGVELFDYPWVQAIVQFFSYLGWALFAVGFVVAGAECAIEYQNGRGGLRPTALAIIKGFLAASLFTTVPVELYRFAIQLQAQFSAAITGIGRGVDLQAADALVSMGNLQLGPGIALFCVIMLGYAVIKVFFANLKRGGVILIMIAVGSLYMFSIPRGYTDGFMGWVKQAIGLCLTAFLQVTVLTAGLMLLPDNLLLGLGLMLAAGEIPRIIGQFGLDTGTRANVMGAIYGAQAAINFSRTIAQVISK